MRFYKALTLLVLLSPLSNVGSAAAAEDYVAAASAYVKANVMPAAQEPQVVEAIQAQNTAHVSLLQSDIDALDQKWRAELESADKPTIDAVVNSPLSKHLAELREKSGGVITELFIMDNKGLNVAQSDPTSDFWQGDEAKWQKSFQVGPDAVFVDDVEKDESTQQLQTQVSFTIIDPASGQAIGAMTVGINVDGL